MREWLNTDFYENSFNTVEQANIQIMLTSENTSDKIFCLSAEEARVFFGSDDSRRAYPTAILLTNGFNTSENYGEWWTRFVSTASNGKGVVQVEYDGNVRSAGTVPYDCGAYTDIGVRPAICIKSSETIATAQNMNLFGYDSNTDLDNEPNLRSSGSYSGSGDSGGKCIICNGTAGYVRYYYGDSDLEAWLSGHDAYTVGTCTSCGGTGKDS